MNYQNIKDKYFCYADTFVYPDGIPIQLGDIIWLNEGNLVGKVVNLIPFPTNIASGGIIDRGFDYTLDFNTECYSVCGFHDIEQLDCEGVYLLNKSELEFVFNIESKLPNPYREQFDNYLLVVKYLKIIKYDAEFTWYCTLTHKQNNKTTDFYYDKKQNCFILIEIGASQL